MNQTTANNPSEFRSREGCSSSPAWWSQFQIGACHIPGPIPGTAHWIPCVTAGIGRGAGHAAARVGRQHRNHGTPRARSAAQIESRPGFYHRTGKEISGTRRVGRARGGRGLRCARGSQIGTRDESGAEWGACNGIPDIASQRHRRSCYLAGSSGKQDHQHRISRARSIAQIEPCRRARPAPGCESAGRQRRGRGGGPNWRYDRLRWNFRGCCRWSGRTRRGQIGPGHEPDPERSAVDRIPGLTPDPNRHPCYLAHRISREHGHHWIVRSCATPQIELCRRSDPAFGRERS